jgi:hypothetical protein
MTDVGESGLLGVGEADLIDVEAYESAAMSSEETEEAEPITPLFEGAPAPTIVLESFFPGTSEGYRSLLMPCPDCGGTPKVAIIALQCKGCLVNYRNKRNNISWKFSVD